MSDSNPYALNSAIPAAQAAVEERAGFLKRTYTWLLGGIVVWCVTMYAVGEVEALQPLAFTIAGNWILSIVLLMAGGFAVRVTATKQLIGPIVYALYAVFFGLLVGPFVMMAEQMDPNIVAEASLTTGLVFIGLTAYVFISGKDFSFLGGFLTIAFWGILVTLICGLIFGFSLGIGMSIVIALLYCGYILYDTGQILHHYPTNMHIAAAATLFSNVVLLFYHILLMFMSRDD
jgi:FtsH-binding integral membrane protein